MQPRLEKLSPKLMIGQRQTMSLAKNNTPELFRAFMPRRKEIVQAIDLFVYDLRVYPVGYFAAFNPNTPFTKWALVEVDQVGHIPEGMESFHLQEGDYAVFTPTGGSHDPSIFQYIFGQWLPNSGFTLADRPHFERLDPKGKRNNPEAEEEIWIPIQLPYL